MFDVALNCRSATAQPPGQLVLLEVGNGLLAAAAAGLPLLEVIEVLGQPATREATTLRGQLGLIGHGAMLYRDLSALENLVFFGKLYGVPDPAKRAAELLRTSLVLPGAKGAARDRAVERGRHPGREARRVADVRGHGRAALRSRAVDLGLS